MEEDDWWRRTLLKSKKLIHLQFYKFASLYVVISRSSGNRRSREDRTADDPQDQFFLKFGGRGQQWNALGREGAIEGNAFLFRDIDVGGKERTLGECFWEGECFFN